MKRVIFALIALSFMPSCDYIGDYVDEVIEYKNPRYPEPVKLVVTAFQYSDSNNIGGYYYLLPADNDERRYETTRAKGTAWYEVREKDNTILDKEIYASEPKRVHPKHFKVIRRKKNYREDKKIRETVVEIVVIHEIINLADFKKNLDIKDDNGKVNIIFFFKRNDGMILYDHVADVSFHISSPEKEQKQEKPLDNQPRNETTGVIKEGFDFTK